MTETYSYFCLYLNSQKINECIEEHNGSKYFTLVSPDGKNTKNYVMKSDTLLDQQEITQTIIIRNIRKSNLILMMI